MFICAWQLFGCDIFVYESTETKKIRMDRFSYLLLYFWSAEFFFPVRSAISKSDNC